MTRLDPQTDTAVRRCGADLMRAVDAAGEVPAGHFAEPVKVTLTWHATNGQVAETSWEL